MSYQNKINEVLGNVHNTSVATKILQFMQKVHNNSDERYAIRWFSELLQNTHDCKFPEQGVKIRFTITDDELIYQHNSKPFRVKDILSLINQVTSKIDDEETTGKFGTGFMTTMLLSDKVTIKSLLKDGEEDCKPFEVEIDRSPDTAQGIIDAINEAIYQLRLADEASAITEFDTDDFNTTFSYKLLNERSRKAAETGIRNLIIAAPYIFAFMSDFESIEVNCNMTSYQANLLIENKEYNKITSLVSRYTCLVDGEEKQILVYSRDGIKMAVPVNGTDIESIDGSVARLFINYPLVGSERFPFPVVLNCDRLLPNEPRSNIALQDNESSKDSVTNKQIITDAIGYYREFLDVLIVRNFGGLNNFVSMPEQEFNSEHSEEFLKSSVYAALLTIISARKIIKCNDGFLHAIVEDELFIVKGECKSIIKELLFSFKDVLYPAEPDNWEEVLLGYDLDAQNYMTLESLLEQVNKMKTGNSTLRFKEDTDVVKWFSNLYKLCRKSEVLSYKVSLGQFACIPTQECSIDNIKIEFLTNLRKDPGFSESFKNLCDDIGVTESIRSFLIHKDFGLDESEKVAFASADFYSANVTRKVRDADVNNKIGNICMGMILQSNFDSFKKLIAGTHMEQFAKDYSGLTEIPEIEMLEAGRYVIKFVLSKAWGGATTIRAVLNYLEIKPEDEVEYLNNFYTQLGSHVDSYFYWTLKILPAYSGSLIGTQEASMVGFNDTNILDALFQVSPEYKSRVVLKDIQYRELKTDVLDLQKACSKIDSFFISIFEGANKKDLNDLSDDINTAAMTIFDWLDKHPEEAAFFPYLRDETNRMRLLNCQRVKELNDKSKTLDKLLDKHGCTTVEELEEKLAGSVAIPAQLVAFLKAIGLDTDNLSESELRNMIEIAMAKEGIEDLFSNVNIGKYYGDSETSINPSDLPQEFVNFYLANGDESRIEKLKRDVGYVGEREAFNSILDFYKNDGFEIIRESSTKAYAKKEYRNITIENMNGVNTANEGYDIVIREEDMQPIYIEVKTHTVTSVLRDRIKLSRAQLQFACECKSQYIVLVMDLLFDNWYSNSSHDPEALDLLTCKPRKYYKDIPDKIGAKKLGLMNKEYLFSID